MFRGYLYSEAIIKLTVKNKKLYIIKILLISIVWISWCACTCMSWLFSYVHRLLDHEAVYISRKAKLIDNKYIFKSVVRISLCYYCCFLRFGRYLYSEAIIKLKVKNTKLQSMKILFRSVVRISSCAYTCMLQLFYHVYNHLLI